MRDEVLKEADARWVEVVKGVLMHYATLTQFRFSPTRHYYQNVISPETPITVHVLPNPRPYLYTRVHKCDKFYAMGRIVSRSSLQS